MKVEKRSKKGCSVAKCIGSLIMLVMSSALAFFLVLLFLTLVVIILGGKNTRYMHPNELIPAQHASLPSFEVLYSLCLSLCARLVPRLMVLLSVPNTLLLRLFSTS